MKKERIKYAAACLSIVCSLGLSGVHAQVKVPQVDDRDFASSNIQLIMDGQNEVGIISKEYVVDPKGGNTKYLIYLPKADRSVDLSIGYDTRGAGYLSFDAETGKAVGTYTDLDWNGEVYISTGSQVEYKVIVGARTATLKPLLLTDHRANESEQYALLKIGNMIWIRENLRTKTFRDGTPITTGLTKKQWEETKSAAVTYYDNDIQNRATMGGLYNWYAVIDDRGLAPIGWKMPERKDWDAMIKLLDTNGFMPDPDDESILSYIAGQSLKSTNGWTTPPNAQEKSLKPGNNASMMDLRPYGSTSTSTYLNGYSSKGQQAYFWTSTQYEYESSKVYFIRLLWDSDIANTYFADKFMGYSVRCLAIDPIQLSAFVPNNPSELNLTIDHAGTMATKIDATQMDRVTKLTLKGTLDARDFATIRQFKNLQYLYLEDISITPYKGDQGTIVGVKQYYEDEIPARSFTQMTTLSTFIATGKITSVGANSFDGCTALSSVSLPNTATEMGGANFRHCISLRNIDLPETMTDLGYGTFEGCTALSSVKVSDKVKEFGDNLFKDCKSLSSLNIPSVLESIGTSAFESCTAITSIDLPASIQSIGSFTFTQCTGIKSVSIGLGLKEIEYGAFLGCIALNRLILSEGIESIGAFSFQGCVELQQLSLPVSVNRIGNGAFRATSINFSLPERSLFKIEDQALLSKDGKVFYYVPARFKGKVIIPEGVEIINGAAFADCKGLTIADLPASIRSIKVAAFENTSIYEMTLRVRNPKDITLGEDIFGRIDLSRCILYVPDDSFTMYETMDPWKQFKLAKMSTPIQTVEYQDTKIYTRGDHQIVVNTESRYVGQVAQLIDLNGRTILQKRLNQGETVINATHLNGGIYLLRINSFVAKISLL